MVAIEGSELLRLDSVAIDLSNGVLQLGQRPPRLRETGAPAVASRDFSITGAPLQILGRPLELRLHGRDVAFVAGKGENGDVILSLDRVEEGKVEFTIDRADLENVLTKVAAEQAAAQGITIEDVQMDLKARDERTLEARVKITARKMIFRTTININGTVQVDEAFVARFSDLKCHGDGAIGKIACAAIQTQFSQMENRGFALTAFPLGGARLRNLRLTADSRTVGAYADFAS